MAVSVAAYPLLPASMRAIIRLDERETAKVAARDCAQLNQFPHPPSRHGCVSRRADSRHHRPAGSVRTRRALAYRRARVADSRLHGGNSGCQSGTVRDFIGHSADCGPFDSAGARPIDTILVAGGRGTTAALRDRALLDWLRSSIRRTRRLCSVCTGAFLLAEAGLLDGLRATTHWRQCERLAARYPAVSVETDPIFVRASNSKIFTSAGVTAGIDLALALLEDDHGRDVALAVARELVMFLRRPGGQSQFSVQLSAQVADREPIRDLQRWIADHLGADLSVDALARRAAVWKNPPTASIRSRPSAALARANLCAARLSAGCTCRPAHIGAASIKN